MSRDRVQHPEAREAQEAVLAEFPMKLCWNCNASKTIILDVDLCLLCPFVLKDYAEPRVNEARNIDRGCGNEVVPTC